MSGQDHRAPDTAVEHPPRGFNGLPEIEDLGLVAPTNLAFRPWSRLRNPRTGALAPWAAVAAIVVPAVIAYRTLRRRGRPADHARGAGAQHRDVGTDVAAPHGDKLLFRQH